MIMGRVNYLYQNKVLACENVQCSHGALFQLRTLESTYHGA
jgi:hypothetical protein